MVLSDFNQFPGGELIRRGFDIPEVNGIPPEHRLYDLLRRADPDAAPSQYNALIRRLVRFERAVECAA